MSPCRISSDLLLFRVEFKSSDAALQLNTRRNTNSREPNFCVEETPTIPMVCRLHLDSLSAPLIARVN
jgi:hypothetical protein